MKLINTENILTFTESDILNNLKFFINLFKNYDNNSIVIVSDDIAYYVQFYVSLLYNYSKTYKNINTLLYNNIIIDDKKILNTYEILVLNRNISSKTEIKIRRYLTIERLKLNIDEP